MMLDNRNEELPASRELLRVLADARTEAVHLGHNYIGTEHVLLALVSNRDSAIASALARSAINEVQVRATLRDIVGQGRARPADEAELPYTSRTKAALARAADVARELGQMQVTPEHLLVGFMREQKNIAAQVLQLHGLTLEAAEEIARDAV